MAEGKDGKASEETAGVMRARSNKGYFKTVSRERGTKMTNVTKSIDDFLTGSMGSLTL